MKATSVNMNETKHCKSCGADLNPRTKYAAIGQCQPCWYLTEPAIADRYFDENEYPRQSATAHYRLEER